MSASAFNQLNSGICGFKMSQDGALWCNEPKDHLGEHKMTLPSVLPERYPGEVFFQQRNENIQRAEKNWQGTKSEQFETIIGLLTALAEEQRRLNGALAENAARIEVVGNNVRGQNHFLVELKGQISALENLVQRNADALLMGQVGLGKAVQEPLERLEHQATFICQRVTAIDQAVAIKRKRTAESKKRRR